MARASPNTKAIVVDEVGAKSNGHASSCALIVKLILPALAIVDSLLSNFVKAVDKTGVKNISGGGGVMANSRLREKMNIFAENNQLNIYLPTPKLSTDNAAMICVAAQNNLTTNDINADDVRLSSIIA